MEELKQKQNDYKVTLDVFEGPLDLLLHLIKKEDISIYDIPISKLLDHYIDYLQLARELDIDLAGEFIEMAAELTHIKSKMLLPEPESEEDEGPDPREELVRRLLEYQKFKMAAQNLISRPLLGQDLFTRPAATNEEEESSVAIDIEPLALVSAFQDILKRLPKEHVHEIARPRMGVAERILELTEILSLRERMTFEDLLMSGERIKTRIDLVVTFLAVLEMAKQKLIRIAQEGVFRQIVISPLISSAESITELRSAEGENDGTESTTNG